MKHFFTFAILLLLALRLPADEVTMIVISYPENTPTEDEIYVAGNFNGWNPVDPAFMLTENLSGQPQIVIEGSGSIEFKFTRGSWETVEGDANGGYLPNRTFTFDTADTLEITIMSWEDLGGGNHTAAENVVVMAEDFYMPQLDRYRRIWLYLPPDYDSTGKDYPVLYMHDGQNLFDAATSFAGEWEVDETLNELFDEGYEVPVVVGIDNGGANRIAEYTPWPNPDYGGGDGDLYAQFIVETLKPYIDDNYRTKPGCDFTGIMGSSLGGLISHYIAIKYQDIFSRAGIFSPSYWFTGDIYDFTYNTGKQYDMRFYIMGGTDEGEGVVEDMTAMTDTLRAAGFGEQEMTLKVVEGGQHNENLWRQEFGEAFRWMFNESSSGIIDKQPDHGMRMSVVNGKLYVIPKENQPVGKFEASVFSISGQNIYQSESHTGLPVLLPEVRPGIYIIRIKCLDEMISQKVFLP